MGMPAARIGDNHICPMVTGLVPHVGGPILIGHPTVLIGGMPAARIADQALCVGPPDMIARGSAGVFIGGKPAARMMDNTVHGGMIMIGCPTVLIGEVDAASGSVAVAAAPGGGFVVGGNLLIQGTSQFQEQALNDVVLRSQTPAGMTGLKAIGAMGVPTVIQSPADLAAKFNFESMSPAQLWALQAATGKLETAKAALDKARIAADVYNPQSQLDNYRRIPTSEMPSSLRDPALWRDAKSGFHAELYESKLNPGQYVLAYEGTDFKDLKGDWKNNAEQALGRSSRQYEQGVDLAQRLKNSPLGDKAEIVGHSLGGGIAAAAGTVTGLPTTTFNAAGVHPNTLANYGMLREDATMVTNYRVQGEVLTGLQENASGILGGLGYVAGGALGGIGGYAAGKQVPTAVGGQVDIPAVDAAGEPVSLWHANPVSRHGMDYVQNGMGKQVADDEAHLGALLSQPPLGGAGHGAGHPWP